MLAPRHSTPLHSLLADGVQSVLVSQRRHVFGKAVEVPFTDRRLALKVIAPALVRVVANVVWVVAIEKACPRANMATEGEGMRERKKAMEEA